MLSKWFIGKYSLLINTEKTKVMASDGKVSVNIHQHPRHTTGASQHIRVAWVTDRGGFGMHKGFRARLNTGQTIRTALEKLWNSHGIHVKTKIRLEKALIWPVVTYCCESWT